MVLVKSSKIFHLSILGKTGQDNAFRNILERKKRPFRPQKEEVKKDEILGFFESPWFLLKLPNFSIFLFEIK